MTTPELKPCPFCGGDKNVICCTDYDGRDAYAVSCRYHDCHGAIFTLGYGYFADKAEAIAAWNTRANIIDHTADRIEQLNADVDTALTIADKAADLMLQMDDRRLEAEAKLVKVGALLPDDLYDSKDWRHADALGRIDWLIRMLANKNEEIDVWVGMLNQKETTE